MIYICKKKKTMLSPFAFLQNFQMVEIILILFFLFEAITMIILANIRIDSQNDASFLKMFSKNSKMTTLIGISTILMVVFYIVLKIVFKF